LIWLLLGGALILLIVFVVYERIFPDPMLDLKLFQARIFSAAALSAVLNYICLYVVIFLLPFYLIQGRGLRPDQAGLILTAQPLIMVIAAPLSGNLSDRLGSRLLSTLGMLVLAGGLFWLSSLNAESPLWLVSAILAVIGLGVGLFSSPNNSALMGAAPRQQQGVAGGVLATARNVGMSLGVALAGAIFNTVYNGTAAGGVPNAAFYQGIQISMMVAAGLALLGALTSSVRGAGSVAK
jgi:MFS family permease